MPTWPVRVVGSDGELGRSLGSITRKDDGKITTKGTVATELIERVKLRSGLDDAGAMDLLTAQGWSNGYLALDLG